MSALRHTTTLVIAAIKTGRSVAPSDLPALITQVGAGLSKKPADAHSTQRTYGNGVRMMRYRPIRATRTSHVRDILRH